MQTGLKLLQMTTKRESILMTLYKIIGVLEQDNVGVHRNLEKPTRIPPNGMIVIRDNDAAKETAVLLNPLTYIYELTVQLEVIIQHAEPEIRTYKLDSLLVEIGKLLAEDPTVDGLAEHLQVEPPEFNEEAIEGAATIRSAVVPVTIRFASADALN